MKHIYKAAIITMACFALTAGAQDWYHDRIERFRGEQWRGRIFEQVRSDLDHIGSAAWAAQRERNRLQRTKQELIELQEKLSHNRYDEHELSDVIDSLRKSANDERLSPRDRGVLNDDLARMQDYREHHDHWNH